MTEVRGEPTQDPGIDPKVVEQIQARLVTADVDELFEGIARQLPADQKEVVIEAAGIKLPSPAQIGKAFYDKIMPQVQDGVCRKAKYCKNRARFETAAQITAIAAKYTADAIAASFGVTVPVVGDGAGILVEATALVLKNGLNKLCGCPD